jgi:F-type H+-transporting ATPase subunit b
MLIDWFTVAAQILNFLILVWLLKHFLYQPILDAIDARETRIANELADAARKQKVANFERDEFNKKNADFELHRNKLMQQATDAANEERRRLLEDARTAADDLTIKRQLSLQREEQTLNDELRHLVCTQVFSIARKTLIDLSGRSLEAAITRMFIQQLQKLQGDRKSSFADAVKKANNSVLVRSAFELSDKERDDLRQALNIFFSAEIFLQFEDVDSSIGGIELRVDGQVIAWTIESYLVALEKNIVEILTPTTKPTTTVKFSATSKPKTTSKPTTTAAST